MNRFLRGEIFCRSSLFVLLLAFTVCVLPGRVSAACDPPPSGLVSWWRAEGNALDSAGFNNGTLAGGVSYGPGMVGQAFVFSTTNSAVLLGNPPSLQLQNFTIETWIKCGSSTNFSLSGGDAVLLGNGLLGIAFGFQSSGTLFLSEVGVSAVMVQSGITDTNWHHVAVTKTGTTVVFYVDGVAFPAQTYSGAFSYASDILRIGVLGGKSLTAPFYGAIDELAVYNRALSATEMQGIFTAGASGKCPVPPFITAQPTNQLAYPGTVDTLSVSAGGSPPLSYQWQFDGTNLDGATNAVLTLSPVMPGQAGTYDVVVSNAAGSVQSSNATLTAPPGPSCDPPPAGLVGWWKAEGNARDSVSGHYGSLSGGSYGPGMVGQAFVFSDIGAGVGLGNPTNLQLQNFTIEAWIRRSSSSIVSLDSDGSDAKLLCYGPNGYDFGMKWSGNLYLMQFTASGVEVQSGIIDTNWHHVAVTKTNTTVVFYVDGVAYPAAPYSVTFSFNSSVAIGARGDNGYDSFYGAIDELSVYNLALTGTQIQTIYNAGPAGKCLSPVITAQPTNKVALPGCSATFTVTATGIPPLTYQWIKNGVAISGQTNFNLSLDNLQTSDFGNYQVLVSSAGETPVASSIVSLIPGQGPVAGPDVIQRFASGGVKARVSDLMTNDTDAAIGSGALSIIAVSPTSASNGTVSLQSNWVYYTPPVGFAGSDTFTYTLFDGNCGTNMGVVTVLVKPDSTPTGTFTFRTSGAGSNVLSFDGFPN
ncbi:MAG TPA: LamG-like jellyroll fold domain-containing protein, partial [Verrucomicrobiae bacterium]|nr:LamG-like jellyroll fold domain-containing protein [Verrucomicrobiae bacterium]